MIRHSRNHHIDSAFVYGLAVLLVLAISNVERILTRVKLNNFNFTNSKKIESPSFFKQDTFSKIKIKGKAYVVYDIVDQRIIAEKNSNVMLPIASITKVMTAITARNHYSKNKLITIRPISIDGAYDLGLKNGQVFELDELLKYTLVFSSNDGAQAISDGLGGRKAFVSQMNIDAKNLGLDLYFTQPAGLDENGKLGGVGSALSVAKMIRIARKEFPEILDATTRTRVSVNSSTGKITGIPNTNQDVYNLRGIEASKTGFTDDAGGNLVVVVDISIGHPVAIVVLGSTRLERFSDVQMLYNALQKSN